MQTVDYNREEILSLLEERFSGRNLTTYNVAMLTLSHRFLKLSDAFCLLSNSGNILSAQHLLRPMFDCIMRLFTFSLLDEYYNISERVMHGEKFSKIKVTNIWPELFKNKKEISLSDMNIRRIMQGTGYYKGIDNFYNNTSEYIHFSLKHYYDLVRSVDSFRIGGADTVLHEPIVKEAVFDFNFLQNAFKGTISLC